MANPSLPNLNDLNMNDIARQAQAPQQASLNLAVQPAGLPTAVEIDTVNGPNGQMIVRMITHRPSGIDFLFFDADSAIKVAEGLRASGNAAKVGLTIARPS